MEPLETAVALTIFNNPDATRRVFSRIATARPQRLFLISDAPRVDRPGEEQLIEQARGIAKNVNWDCQVEMNFTTENLGPRRRIISGLDWVFSRVEAAIFLEHDCLPNPTFFPFCFELLELYRNQPQIGYISGFNPLERKFPFKYSYYFSRLAHLWGWATWRRTWLQYDEHMKMWPEVKSGGLLELLFPDKKIVAYWSGVFDRMHDGTGPNTWDYQLFYTCWTRNWVNIISRNNLIKYIGFVPSALHTRGVEPGFDLDASPIDLPLLHPPAITSWPAQEMGLQHRFYARNLYWKIRRRLIIEYNQRFRS